MSFLKNRVYSEPIVTADLSAAHGTIGLQPPKPITAKLARTGAASRIMAGIFGTPNRGNLSAEVSPFPGKQGVYSYTEGDLFTPGAQNWVFEYPFEFPLQTIWGRSFLRKPNTFKVNQPPQVYSQPNVFVNGIGGLVAGQFIFQPLETLGQ